MKIRLPYISAAYTNAAYASDAAAPARLVSTRLVEPVGAKIVLVADSGPYDIDIDFSTAVAGAQTITTAAHATVEEMLDELLSLAEAVNLSLVVSSNGSTITIETVETGSTSTAVFDATWLAGQTCFSTANDFNGNAGAANLQNIGDSFNIEVDGVADSWTASGFIDTDGPTQVAAAIQTALAGTTVTESGGRIIIESSTNGSDQTLEITTAGWLFAELDFSRGKSNDATSDSSDADAIRLYHPADPVFFRTDNRPLFDLAANDLDLRREWVALRNGYDEAAEAELTSSDERLKFKAPAGYTFETPVTFKSDILLEGSFIQKEVSLLRVEDRTITVNFGETGAGVSGDGIAGLRVDRGSASPAVHSLTFNEATTSAWSIVPAAIWEASTNFYSAESIYAEEGIHEQSQVTIGDGVTTFGHVNDTNFATAMASAVSLLGASGGKIYVKRGTYTSGALAIDSTYDDVTVVGEGAATVIDQSAVITVTAANFSFQNLTFTGDTGAELSFGTGSEGAIIAFCRFTEGTSRTDVSGAALPDVIFVGCVSTTTTTNLP